MSSAPSGRKGTRIVVTTEFLTEQVTQEDHGAEGKLILYGSSHSQMTQEAEYVPKGPEFPGICNSRGIPWNNPAVTALTETEQQLLLLERDNGRLRLQLEATREGGIRALQEIHGHYRTRAEESREKREKEKEQLQANKLREEEKLQKILENSQSLEGTIREKCVRMEELEKRLERMEEEKQSLIQKKLSLEKLLQQMKSRNEGTEGFLDIQRQISDLREQIQHLQRVIQEQQHSLWEAIREAEELNSQLQSQDRRIKDLSGKVTLLESQNKELKEKVEFWASFPKRKISRGTGSDIPRDLGTLGMSPYLLLTRMKKQES